MNETNILSVTENFSDRDHMNLNVSLYFKRYPSKKTFLNFPPYIFITTLFKFLYIWVIDFMKLEGGKFKKKKESNVLFEFSVVPKKNLFRNIFFPLENYHLCSCLIRTLHCGEIILFSEIR